MDCNRAGNREPFGTGNLVLGTGSGKREAGSGKEEKEPEGGRQKVRDVQGGAQRRTRACDPFF